MDFPRRFRVRVPRRRGLILARQGRRRRPGAGRRIACLLDRRASERCTRRSVGMTVVARCVSDSWSGGRSVRPSTMNCCQNVLNAVALFGITAFSAANGVACAFDLGVVRRREPVIPESGAGPFRGPTGKSSCLSYDLGVSASTPGAREGRAAWGEIAMSWC